MVLETLLSPAVAAASLPAVMELEVPIVAEAVLAQADLELSLLRQEQAAPAAPNRREVSCEGLT
jgi:hypothetical protein